MSLIHLADRLFGQPHYILPAKLDAIVDLLRDRLDLNLALSAAAAVPAQLQTTPPVQTAVVHLVDASGRQPAAPRPSADAPRPSQNGGPRVAIGVIPVFGTLVHRAGGIDAMSGLRSYAAIRRDYRLFLADPEVDGILFHFASGGGEGAGLFDLADEIFEGRAQKPSAGMVDEHAYSAAYGLASATGRIYTTRTGGLGSIGIIAKHVNRAAANAQKGLEVTSLFVGARKNDFSPDGPLTAEAKAVMQDILTSGYDLFVETVARNRGLKEKTVRATEAGLFQGEAAVKLGLADAVMSFDQALADFAQTITSTKNQKSQGGSRMQGLKHQLEALMKGSSESENQAALAALGYLPAAAGPDQAELDRQLAAAKTAGQAEAKKETLAYAVNLVGLCNLAGLPNLAGPLLEKETPLDAARQQLVDAKAQEAARQPISSKVNPLASGGVNPLLADARHRAGLKD